MGGERLLVVNFKAYPSAFQRFREIAEAASRVARETGVRVVLAVPAPLVYPVSEIHGDVYLQHVDGVPMGARTGFLPAEALGSLPARGTLINHSEHKVTLRELSRVVAAARGAGKEVLACADTPEEAAAVALLGPSMVAVEPPELIGTGVSVSRARPEVITSAVEAVHRVAPGMPVLAGAGISGPEDARRSIELGASGVLVASYVMKAPDPGERMRLLAEGLAGAP